MLYEAEHIEHMSPLLPLASTCKALDRVVTEYAHWETDRPIDSVKNATPSVVRIVPVSSGAG